MYVCVYVICVYLFVSLHLSTMWILPVNVIVRLTHPRSGEQTRNYDTECWNHHPSLSTLRSKGLSSSKIYIFRGYFKSVWTAVYRFWVHLIWALKLGKTGKKVFCESKHMDISCKYFSFLAYQRSVQLLYETLDTLIEALTAFTVRQS